MAQRCALVSIFNSARVATDHNSDIPQYRSHWGGRLVGEVSETVGSLKFLQV